jgi:hypothetical protein
MGWIKDAKQDTLATQARRAIEEGRTVFVPMLNTPMFASAMSGPVPGWAEMVEAVETQGWHLEHWAIGQDKQGRPQAYPLFRRVGAVP